MAAVMDDEFVLSAEKEMDEEIKKLLAMKTRDRDYAMTLKGTIGGLQNLVRELTAYSLASIPKPEEINAMSDHAAANLRAEMEFLTFKSVYDQATCLKKSSINFEKFMENSHFFELLRALKDNGTGEDDASTSSGSIDESLRRSADAMERKLHQAFSYLKSFEDEMERVKFFMLKKYNKLPECPVMEPPVPRTCEELQEDLVRLVPQVTSSEEEDDDDADEWQDIDDDEQDEENKYQPDAADLENVVYGFHSLFGSFSELDMSKHLRLNEDQYAQFARMLIRCLPTKEMKERYGKLAQSYEDYTRALFEDLDTRRILRPNGEEYEDDEEYEIELKRRKADRERKILNFIGSLKYLKEQFDDDLHMANMVQGQMQDAQLFYAELQEEKRKEG